MFTNQQGIRNRINLNDLSLLGLKQHINSFWRCSTNVLEDKVCKFLTLVFGVLVNLRLESSLQFANINEEGLIDLLSHLKVRRIHWEVSWSSKHPAWGVFPPLDKGVIKTFSTNDATPQCNSMTCWGIGLVCLSKVHKRLKSSELTKPMCMLLWQARKERLDVGGPTWLHWTLVKGTLYNFSFQSWSSTTLSPGKRWLSINHLGVTASCFDLFPHLGVFVCWVNLLSKLRRETNIKWRWPINSPRLSPKVSGDVTRATTEKALQHSMIWPHSVIHCNSCKERSQLTRNEEKIFTCLMLACHLDLLPPPFKGDVLNVTEACIRKDLEDFKSSNFKVKVTSKVAKTTLLAQMRNNLKRHHVGVFTGTWVTGTRWFTIQNSTCDPHVLTQCCCKLHSGGFKNVFTPRHWNCASRRLGKNGNTVPLASWTRMGTKGHRLTPNAKIKFRTRPLQALAKRSHTLASQMVSVTAQRLQWQR